MLIKKYDFKYLIFNDIKTNDNKLNNYISNIKKSNDELIQYFNIKSKEENFTNEDYNNLVDSDNTFTHVKNCIDYIGTCEYLLLNNIDFITDGKYYELLNKLINDWNDLNKYIDEKIENNDF